MPSKRPRNTAMTRKQTPQSQPGRPLIADLIKATAPACQASPTPLGRTPGHGRAFTLIELLVVISIIALLIGILLPVLGNARKSAHATNSLANMRSWGQGTHGFLNDHDFLLPWEGEQHSIADTYPEDMWWGNAIPPYVDQPTYAMLWIAAVTAGRPVPQPPDRNIFIDPSATIGPEQMGVYTQQTLPYFFSYVWNASLTDGNRGDRIVDGKKRMLYDAIPSPSEVILMFELRSDVSELSFLKMGDPGYYEKFEDDQIRMKGDYKHLAGRHFEGGHMVYADGHATHQKFIEAYGGPGWSFD